MESYKELQNIPNGPVYAHQLDFTFIFRHNKLQHIIL